MSSLAVPRAVAPRCSGAQLRGALTLPKNVTVTRAVALDVVEGSQSCRIPKAMQRWPINSQVASEGILPQHIVVSHTYR